MGQVREKSETNGKLVPCPLFLPLCRLAFVSPCSSPSSRPRPGAYSFAANPAKGSPVAPCVIIPGQAAAVRDSQHRCAKVHVHRFLRVCQWLILILVDQRSAFRVIYLNHCRTTP